MECSKPLYDDSIFFLTLCEVRTLLVFYLVALDYLRGTDLTRAQREGLESHSLIRTRSIQTPVGPKVRLGHQAPGEKRES